MSFCSNGRGGKEGREMTDFRAMGEKIEKTKKGSSLFKGR